MSGVVLDSSAVIALLEGEADAAKLADILNDIPERVIGAPTLVEASIVLGARHGAAGEMALDAFLQRLDVRIVAMGAREASLARQAYRRFGRGVGSPAVLNYGDCLAFAIAQSRGWPLLCIGKDFAQTDIGVAGESD